MIGAIKLRTVVKNMIIKRGGMINGYDVRRIMDTYGVHACDVQNALSYFRFSPQQASFRAKYGIK